MRRYFTHKTTFDEEAAITAIQEKATIIWNKESLDILIKRAGDARIVMLGEASHGTHEYYTWRSMLSQRLIKEKGFNFIAVEGDWPDCYKVNRYIKGYMSNNSAKEVLRTFNRWPTWMWANWEIVALAEWLKNYNSQINGEDKIGFYGLDVYSLWESMQAIMEYLYEKDPSAVQKAEEAMRCFEPYIKDEGKAYALASRFVPELCEDEVVNLLKEIRYKLAQYDSDPENVFSTEQNALVAVNAERYYRAMIQGGPHSWNIRDHHMEETLERLLTYHGKDSKVIIWAHNTHIGDARATDMVSEGMYNLGELARMKYGKDEVFLVGFGSYKGEVTASKSWGAPIAQMTVPAAVRGSWEYLLHKTGPEDKLLLMEDFMTDPFAENHIGQRAIGVVYNPDIEQYGNYVPSILPLRYDAFVYIDRTKSLHTLNVEADDNQTPQTYPFGI